MAKAGSRGTALRNLSLMLCFTDWIYFLKKFLRYSSLASDNVRSARCRLPSSHRDAAKSYTAQPF